MLPEDLERLAGVEYHDLRWKVTNIEWSLLGSGESDEEIRNYSWASDFCKSVEVDLGFEPEVTEFYNEDWYACVFSHADRELEVSSLNDRTIGLSYVNEVWEEMDAAHNAVN